MTTRETSCPGPGREDVVAALRRRVGSDEPAFTLSAERVIVAGRRRLRTRRTSLALRAAACGVVVACLAAQPAPADGAGSAPTGARAPVTTTTTDV